MNARILELIKEPGQIQNQDLNLIDLEISKYPYLQNIRALRLIGTNQFEFENYQKVLSVTAAYTTDKKILYQLINKKTETEIVPVKNIESKDESNSEAAETVKSPFDEVSFVPKPTIKPIYVDGILNRILFEGEEDFLERENEMIDIESTLESGKIVTLRKSTDVNNNSQPVDNERKTPFAESNDAESFSPEMIVKVDDISQEENRIEDSNEKSFHEVQAFSPSEEIKSENTGKFTETEDSENFTPELIIEEREIVREEPIIEDLSKISFHGLEEFLPEVKISSSNPPQKYEVPKPQLTKQEVEMQKLIAQVQEKVKASKKDKIVTTEIVENHEVNFSESQRSKNIVVPETLNDTENKGGVQDVKVQKTSQETTISQIVENVSTSPDTPEKSSWKPINFSENNADSFREKKSSALIPGESKEISAIKEAEISEERPVFNASFFTENVSLIESENTGVTQNEIVIPQKNGEVLVDSNIPVFINTWQNWLKIERKADQIKEKQVISKEEVKNTVIENFIEKEPKISKLKEESDFVVKEKGSNISHLMTETLAKLYVEQKLYAKAIKGYEALAVKHPEKAEYFQSKIHDVKELRKNP